jgi:hypothetical protein
MRGLALADDAPVPEIAEDSRDDAERHAARFEHRPLLDVNLEECGDLAWVEQRVAPSNRGNVGADICQMRTKRTTGVDARLLKISLREEAEQRPCADP